MRTVLVTGGAGFIGSAVCRAWAGAAGWRLVNLDKLTYAANVESLADLKPLGTFSLVEGDINERALVDDLLRRHQPDAIVHLAAESHVDRSITGSAEFVKTNVVGTHALLEAALAYWDKLPSERKEAFRFLHVSTDEVFGSLGPDGYFSETTPYDPRSPYSATKAASDHLVSAWHHTYGLPVLISNCSNNYGPYQFPEKLIPLMILNGLEYRALPVYGDGQNIRDWLFVDDHVSALKLVLENGRAGQTYNIGGRAERTNLQVVHAICDALDELAPTAGRSRRDLIAYVKDRPGHDRRYAIDCAKIENELGWTQSESFETGLKKTVAWYLERRDWWGPLRTVAEQRLGLR